eukprot:symbB.v1.2.003935.t1/scaffold210.1/size302740/26
MSFHQQRRIFEQWQQSTATQVRSDTYFRNSFWACSNFPHTARPNRHVLLYWQLLVVLEMSAFSGIRLRLAFAQPTNEQASPWKDSTQLGAWLGISFALPTVLRCLRLHHNGAEGFIIETLQGQWQPWRQLAYAPAGQLRLRIPPEPVCNPEMVDGEEGVIDLPHCDALSQWRLWGPQDPQVDSWTVYELHFYIDDICTQVASGTIGLPFAQSESLQAWQRLTDGDLATAWSVATGASMAWAGAAFNRSVAVRCVRVAQYFETADTTDRSQILEARRRRHSDSQWLSQSLHWLLSFDFRACNGELQKGGE